MTAAQTWTFPRHAEYGPGPWADEPDKLQWIDAASGLDCLILRNGAGALCGYVGVGPKHPWHGKGYSESLCGHDGCYEHTPGDVRVHGGLTFAAGRAEGEGDDAIRHVPEAGRPADVWWFGFDTAHSGDLVPSLQRVGYHADRGDHYRDVAYVQGECAELAAQLSGVGR